MQRATRQRSPTSLITMPRLIAGGAVIGLVYLIGTRNIQKFALGFLSKARTEVISSIQVSSPFVLQAIVFAFFRSFAENRQDTTRRLDRRVS